MKGRLLFRWFAGATVWVAACCFVLAQQPGGEQAPPAGGAPAAGVTPPGEAPPPGGAPPAGGAAPAGGAEGKPAAPPPPSLVTVDMMALHKTAAKQLDAALAAVEKRDKPAVVKALAAVSAAANALLGLDYAGKQALDQATERTEKSLKVSPNQPALERLLVLVYRAANSQPPEDSLVARRVAEDGGLKELAAMDAAAAGAALKGLPLITMPRSELLTIVAALDESEKDLATENLLATKERLVTASALSHVWVGMDLGKKELVQESMAEFEKALSLDPQCAPAYVGMAYGYRSLGIPEKVLASAKKAREVSPQDPRVQIIVTEITKAVGDVFPPVVRFIFPQEGAKVSRESRKPVVVDVFEETGPARNVNLTVDGRAAGIQSGVGRIEFASPFDKRTVWREYTLEVAAYDAANKGWARIKVYLKE